MKAILISIKPKWVAKILNGEKTIEIRKTMPNCDLPIDVYIYCTKDVNNGLYWAKKWVCVNQKSTIPSIINGKVVAKFTLNKVEEILIKPNGNYYTNTLSNNKLLIQSCLSQKVIFEYTNCHISKISGCWFSGYAWHISNLEIFDKPKELSEFYKSNEQMEYIKSCWENYGLPDKDDYNDVILTKAPQSWCYVEVEIE